MRKGGKRKKDGNNSVGILTRDGRSDLREIKVVARWSRSREEEEWGAEEIGRLGYLMLDGDHSNSSDEDEEKECEFHL